MDATDKRADERSPRSDILAAWRHYEGFHRRIVAAGAASAVGAFAELLVLAILATLTSLIGTDNDVFSAKVPGLSLTLTTGQLLGIAAVLILVRGAFKQIDTSIEANLATSYEDHTRARLMSAFLEASWPAQAAQRSNELQEVTNVAVVNGRIGIKSMASSLGDLGSALIMLAGAFTASWLTSVIASAVSALIVFALLPLVRRTKKVSGEVSQAALSYASSLGETVDLSREIRVFGVDDAFESRLQRLSTRLRRLRRREQLLIGTAPTLFETAALLLVLSGFAALYLLNLGNTTRFVTLLLVLLRASQYGRSVQTVYHQLRSSLPYLQLIDEREADLRSTRPHAGHTTVDGFRSLVLDDVTYSYGGDHDALRHVSLDIGGGDLLGVIGPSGSGKSTLVELLLGLRQPTRGRVLLDGEDLAEVDPATWHGLVGLVPQDARMIEGDVSDNIRFLRDRVTDDDIAYAVAAAGLDRDVASLPLGMATPIGPRQSGLSGGQRQRLSIARVLAGRPELLILDEPTSALDVHAESVVTDTLERLKGTITIVVVAHRLSTLRICERVMVMRDGRVDALGARAELERDNSYYRSAIELAHLTA